MNFTPCEHGGHPMGCLMCQAAIGNPARQRELNAARAEAVLAFAATLPNYVFEDLSEGCTTQPGEYAAEFIAAQGWLPQEPKE